MFKRCAVKQASHEAKLRSVLVVRSMDRGWWSPDEMVTINCRATAFCVDSLKDLP